MGPEELKKYNQKQKIDYKALGLKKTYYEPGETPAERLGNLLSPTTILASIIKNESNNDFKNLSQNKQLQDIVTQNAKIVANQLQDIHDYLHDVSIFYKYFDQEGSPKNFNIWLKKTYDSFFR